MSFVADPTLIDPPLLFESILNTKTSKRGHEVHGREYTFSSGGVFHHTPKAAPGVKFRGSVVLGTVRMSSREVEDVVGRLRDRFPGDSYHILKRNCNSFAEELCMELTGGQRPPGWVNRLARLGACVSCCLPASLTDGSPVNEAGVFAASDE